MYMLTIFLEENAFGGARPLEVAAEVPVAALIPKLVAELNLPQTDLFGKELVYMLRLADGGQVLPEQSSLRAAGVQDGSRLLLDSYVMDGSVAAMAQQRQRLFNATSLHSSNTIADSKPLATVGVLLKRERNSGELLLSQWSAPMSPLPDTPVRPPRKRSRRRFLWLAGGLILGSGGGALGYEAYAQFASNPGNTRTNNGQQATGQKTTTQTPAKTAALPTNAQHLLTFSGHNQTVRAVGWSSKGTMLASGSDDTHLLIWNEAGMVLHDLRHPASVRALAWSPGGQRIVTGANNRVTFFNATSGAQLAQSAASHTQMVTGLAWAGQNQQPVVSVSADTHAVVWETTNYKALQTYALHTVAIAAVGWAADGQTVATSSQGGLVRVWNAQTLQDLHGFYQDAQIPMRALAFAPQGFQLAVGGDDGVVRLWNAQTCAAGANAANQQCTDEPQRLRASQKAVRALAWSPDGRTLAVGTDDGIFSLWALGMQQQPLFTKQQNAAIRSLAWSPDGKKLAMAVGNAVMIWQLM